MEAQKKKKTLTLTFQYEFGSHALHFLLCVPTKSICNGLAEYLILIGIVYFQCIYRAFIKYSDPLTFLTFYVALQPYAKMV